jgi:hypothetical protein
MKQIHWLTILRWFCVLPVVFASFAAAFYLSIPFDNWCYEQAVRFGYQTTIDEELPPYLPLSWYGAFAAAVVVLSGAAVAPAHRRVVALALFVMGALIAIAMSDAIVGPLVGGALAVACVYLVTHRSAARLDRTPPGSTSAARPA